MVENRYWLVIDSAPGHTMESRFHTYATYERGPDWVSLTRGDQQMMMTFATLGGGVMQESRGMPSSPREQTTIFRWMSNGASRASLQVAALNPGKEKLTLALSKEKGDGFAIQVNGPNGYQRVVRVSRTLKLEQ